MRLKVRLLKCLLLSLFPLYGTYAIFYYWCTEHMVTPGEYSSSLEDWETGIKLMDVRLIIDSGRFTLIYEGFRLKCESGRVLEQYEGSLSYAYSQPYLSRIIHLSDGHFNNENVGSGCVKGLMINFGHTIGYGGDINFDVTTDENSLCMRGNNSGLWCFKKKVVN